MATVSICLLTWNRARVFTQTMERTLKNTGMPWDELVWTDNGSHHEQYAQMEAFMEQFKVTTKVRHSWNTGMPRGFNSSLSLSRSDYVVLIGPDVIMPDGWLALFMEYMEKIPDAGIVAMYVVPHEAVPERYRKSRQPEVINGLPVLRAMPFDHFIVKRSIFQKVGYWREDFGPYGWSDVEWLERCEKMLPEMGLNCYVMPHIHGDHHAVAGADEFRMGVAEDTPEYQAWKAEHAASKYNHDKILFCRHNKWPYYSPF